MSARTGDRLGLAAPGPIWALKSRQLFPNFDQQSVHELHLPNRSAIQIRGDAPLGVFQEGWRGKWGADADHLKTVEEPNKFINAGVAYFTIDAGDCVQEVSQINNIDDFDAYHSIIRLSELKTELHTLRPDYCDHEFSPGAYQIKFDLYRTIAKLGNWLAQTGEMVYED